MQRRLAAGSSLISVLPVLALIAVAAPEASGQYAVGTADVTYVDPDRGNRQVPCDLYYPATAAGSGQPVASPPPEGFAGVAFGHGYQLPAGVYAWIARRLAEAGCVVAVPRTAGELFPNHGEFGRDLALAVRTLRDAGGDAASEFFGRMGPRTLVMGHSMGGGCSYLAATEDPSITAVANFAAAETNPSAVAACASIDRPALLFAGTDDCVTPPADHQIPMFDALAGWRTLATLDGASHCQFNAYSFLCALGEACSAGISRQAQQDLTWLLLEPWVRWRLFLDAGAQQQFRSLLETGSGFTSVQAGFPTGLPPSPSAAALRLEASPNPFRAATVLRIELPVAGAARLEVLDARGRRVRTMDLESGGEGVRLLPWDGRDAAGRAVPAGVFFVRVHGSAGSAVTRVLRLH